MRIIAKVGVAVCTRDPRAWDGEFELQSLNKQTKNSKEVDY